MYYELNRPSLFHVNTRMERRTHGQIFQSKAYIEGEIQISPKSIFYNFENIEKTV